MTPTSDLAAVVLAAGAGTRLQPLTDRLPKALCPVANRPLLDHVLDRIRPHTDRVAVNVHHGREAMLEHLERLDVHVSVEEGEALGTAGGVANLREWIAGRPVLVCNADAWDTDPLDRLLEGWDGRSVRLLVTRDVARPDFDGLWRFAGASLMPWDDVRGLPRRPTGLYEVLWSDLAGTDRLELVPTLGHFVDCGTPADYLAANLVASGGVTVVGEGARVEGRAEASVIWPGAVVASDEHLRLAIRLPDGHTLTPFDRT